jgi:hypothetical protein
MAAKYGRIYAGALKDRRLGRAELKVLGALALNAFSDFSNISEKLAKFLADSGLSRSAWFRGVVRLEAFGYVQRETKGRSVIYKVDPENSPTAGTDKSPTAGTVRAAIDPTDGTARVPAVRLVSPSHGTDPPIKDSLKDFLRDEEEGPPSSSIGCADHFDDPAHGAAYLAYRGTHRMPDSFDAIVRSVHDPATGGDRFDWATIGQALLDLRGVGAEFSRVRLAGFCRHLASADRRPAPGGSSAEVDLSGSKSEHCKYCVATVGQIGGQRRLVPIHAPDCPAENGRRAAS